MRLQKRTTVRSNAVRLGMAALGEVAPSLAARAAARLFLTPPRLRKPAREDRALSQAEPFVVRVRSGTLRCWRLGEGPAVLLVHGWGGRAWQLAPMAAALQERGCAAVTFDGPAHGASSGRTVSVPEFADAAAAVARHASARAAIGHSMGAAALAFAMLRGTSFDAAVFVGPPRNPGGFYDRFCEALDLDPRVRAMARTRLERRVGMRLQDLDLALMSRDAATPLLVVHDRTDGEVDWTDGAAVAGAWPGARLATTRGLGHRRILRDPRVVADAATFVSERLGRCGCGRYACGASGAQRLCDGCLLATEMFERSRRWSRA